MLRVVDLVPDALNTTEFLEVLDRAALELTDSVGTADGFSEAEESVLYQLYERVHFVKHLNHVVGYELVSIPQAVEAFCSAEACKLNGVHGMSITGHDLYVPLLASVRRQELLNPDSFLNELEGA